MSETNVGGRSRFERALRELRRPVQADDLTIARIMNAVRRQKPDSHRRRTLLTVAAIAAIVMSAGVWRLITLSTSTDDGNPSFVQFVYVGPEAREVSLVGSFNDWDPDATPLQREGTEGVWSAEVPLPPGHHEYAFNVDGHWITDADAPMGASDEFGVANSVILVQ